MASPSPSSTSAAWRMRTGRPSRRASPSRCMRQLMSTPVITSAPALACSSSRSRPIRQETASSADREGAAEAAALVGAGRLHQRDAVAACRAGSSPCRRGAPGARCRWRAAARAGRGSCGAGRRCGGSGPSTRRTPRTSWRNSQSSKVAACTFPSAGWSGTRVGELVAHHADAAAARRHHVLVALEGVEEVRAERRRGGRLARVGHGLAAAGLGLGELHRAAVALEEAQGRLGHLRVELVDVAGHEEGDRRHGAKSSHARRRSGSGGRSEVTSGR